MCSLFVKKKINKTKTSKVFWRRTNRRTMRKIIVRNLNRFSVNLLENSSNCNDDEFWTDLL